MPGMQITFENSIFIPSSGMKVISGFNSAGNAGVFVVSQFA